MDAPLPLDPQLSAFVQAVRFQTADEYPRSAPYAVLPGPFPVMGFRVAGVLRVIRESDTELLAPAGMTGIQERPQSYEPLPRTRTVLVVLRPEAAFGLFGVPMDELVNRELALDQLLPARVARRATNRIADARTSAEAIGAVTSLLVQVANDARTHVHPAVIAAVSTILSSHGNARIERIASASSLSRRQIERLFRTQVGVSPKRLASLARFAWAAARVSRAESLSRLAFDAGYSDQAHFVRDFRELAGVTPGHARDAAVDS